MVWKKLLEKSEKVLKKNKSFFAWWLCLLVFLSIPIFRDHFYSESDLQYITIENAEFKYQNGNRYESPCAIINDIYYLPLPSYRYKSREEYDNITSIAKYEKITIGAVDNLRFQILQLNPNCKLVISLTSENLQTFTLERYNNNLRKYLIIDIVFIVIYLLFSLAYVIIIYLLGERKFRKKMKKIKKKRKAQKKIGKK